MTWDQVRAERGLDIGDVVTLSSGGPAMTIAELAGGSARVVWCDDFKKPHAITVDVRALAVVTGGDT